LEYGVSASAVAVSWTGYFLSLLDHFGIHLPAALVSAPLDGKLQPTGAIANLPAAGIVLLLTWLCYVGIRKSSAMNPVVVALKTGGPGKYRFVGGLLGAARVMSADRGFAAVAVAAQESHRRRGDLAIGMLLSLAICTVLCAAMAAVIAGPVPYTQRGADEQVV